MLAGAIADVSPCELIAQPRDRIPSTIQRVATELSINRRDEAGGVVLALSGELDVVSAPALEQHLNEALSEPGAHVTLDLATCSSSTAPASAS